MITDGTIHLYDGEYGEATYNLGKYGLGWLIAEVREREKIVIINVSKRSMTELDFGFNWEHTRKEII